MPAAARGGARRLGATDGELREAVEIARGTRLGAALAIDALADGFVRSPELTVVPSGGCGPDFGCHKGA